MNKILDEAMDEVGALLFIPVLAAAVAAVSLLAFLLWLFISAVITYIRLEAYRAQLAGDFDAELGELGWGFDADDVFYVAFGTRDFSSSRDGNSFDWISGTVLGVEDDDDET